MDTFIRRSRLQTWKTQHKSILHTDTDMLPVQKPKFEIEWNGKWNEKWKNGDKRPRWESALKKGKLLKNKENQKSISMCSTWRTKCWSKYHSTIVQSSIW